MEILDKGNTKSQKDKFNGLKILCYYLMLYISWSDCIEQKSIPSWDNYQKFVSIIILKITL